MKQLKRVLCAGLLALGLQAYAGTGNGNRDVFAREMVYSAYGYGLDKSAKGSPTVKEEGKYKGKDLDKEVREDKRINSYLEVFEQIAEKGFGKELGQGTDVERWTCLWKLSILSSPCYHDKKEFADTSISDEEKRKLGRWCLLILDPKYLSKDHVATHYNEAFNFEAANEEAVQLHERDWYAALELKKKAIDDKL